MLRLGVLCLALVMVTSAVAGLTYAKYVKTSEGGTDSASVAKFGVTFAWTDDDAFEIEYDNGEDPLTVKSIAETPAKIIAPGTNGSMIMTVTGKSEVSFAVTMSVAENYSAGNWKESADGAEYHPVVITVKKGTGESVTTVDGTNGVYTIGSYTAGVDVNETITIEWSWAFETVGKDAADSYMSTVDGATYGITAVATATQVGD